MSIWVKICKYLDFGPNFKKNLDFGQNFENIDLVSFCQKVSNVV